MQQVIDQETFRKHVSVNVRSLRKAAGYSQGQFARKLDITQAHLCRIEGAEASPSAELMFTMATVLGVTVDCLGRVAKKISAKAG
jgi:transcriptional regulator with XRE-family HTH domain